MTYFSPFYSRGHPGMGAGATRQIVDGGTYIEEKKAQIDQLFLADNSWKVQTWIGQINSSALISGATNRWLYQVKKKELTTTPQTYNTNTKDHLDLSTYIDPSKTTPCYNLYEYKHTSTGTLGDGTPVSQIPNGFQVVPVVGVVIVYQSIQESGEILYVFDRQNGLSGQCE